MNFTAKKLPRAFVLPRGSFYRYSEWFNPVNAFSFSYDQLMPEGRENLLSLSMA